MHSTDSSRVVLCFVDNDAGRDVEMLLPLVYFIESLPGVKVIFNFIWDVHAIYRKKPDIVLLPNTVGSKLYFQISQYANECGIPVFALISEGNMRTDGSFHYWGYNTDKTFYQQFVCFWSRRTLDFMKKELPEQANKLVLTGATGFDRYSIYEFVKKEAYLKRLNLTKFKKVIGYAGWAFGKLTNAQGRDEMLAFFKGDESRLQWAEKQMLAVEEILRKVITDNPDILFVLKRHPNEANPSIVEEGRNEMNPLKNLPNVRYVKDEDDLHDLISVSDLWLGFETTTTLEAWLMKENMPTILVNPDPDFNRDALYQGSVMVQSAGELQQLMDEFYASGLVLSFLASDLIVKRKTLIRDTIGFSDGLNHVRAGCYFKQVLDLTGGSTGSKVKFSPRYFCMYCLMEMGKYFYVKEIFMKLPKFKKTVWIFEKFRLKNIPLLQAKYKPYMEKFYRQNNIMEKINQGKMCADLQIENNA
ncbi:MAG: BFO_1060 family glycosyltransferase [Cyclobacteriaceae bacterium]